MKKLYLLLLPLLVLTGCDKDKEEKPETGYPSTFADAQFYSTGSIRMFTKNGEVKDQQVIRAFAARYGSDWYYPDGIDEETTTGEKVILVNASTAKFQSKSSQRDYDLSISGKELLFTSRVEGYVMYKPADAFFYNLSYAIGKVKPITSDKQMVPSTPGFSYRYKIKERISARLEDDRLLFPRLVYTIKAGDSSAYSVSTSGINNEFDPDCLPLLRTNDTLVYQQFMRVSVKE